MKFDQGGATHAGAFSIGTALREAREARGETVGDVAHALKLHARQIEAIEQERFDLLPGKAFVRGFVRNYARHVGLDPEQLAARLPDASPAAHGVQSMELTPPHNARGTLPSGGESVRQSPRGVFVLLLVAVAVLGVAWYFDWFNVSHITQSAAERVGVNVGRDPAPVAAGTGDARKESAPAVVPPQAVVLEQATPVASPTVAPGPTAAPVVGTSTPLEAPSRQTPAETVAVVPGRDAAAPAPAVATPAPTSATPAPATPAPVVAPSPVATPAVQAARDEADASTASTAAGVAPGAETAVGEGSDAVPGQLVFRLRGESWIQVRDASGTTLYMGTGAAGTTRTVQGTPPFAVVVGNAAQVSLEHGGKPFDLTPHTRSGGVARATVE